jgi:hypothetical protein
MMYLRARYYSPAQGRFVSRDVWEGNYNNPLSLNKWGYVEGNPINYTDPSGHYTYHREEAASYAMIWDQKSGYDSAYDISKRPGMDNPDLQCTIFASSVLHHSGVKDGEKPGREDPNPNKEYYHKDIYPPYWDIEIYKYDWQFIGYAGKGSWYNTPAFYDFTTQVIGNLIETHNNPPQFSDTSSKFGSKIDEVWNNKLRSMQGIIKKGDLVFYKGNGEADWGHVAIVVGWGPPTYWGTEPKPGPFIMINNQMYIGYEALQNKCWDPSTELPSRPLVVEKSGGVAYEASRSLDNTANPVQTISIVHVYDN